MLRSRTTRRRLAGYETTRHHIAAQLAGEILETRMLLTLSGNMLFPADNPWNHKINTTPIASNSAALVSSIGSSTSLHPDFGTVYQGANIGIPYMVVPGNQPKVPV